MQFSSSGRCNVYIVAVLCDHTIDSPQEQFIDKAIHHVGFRLKPTFFFTPHGKQVAQI